MLTADEFNRVRDALQNTLELGRMGVAIAIYPVVAAMNQGRFAVIDDPSMCTTQGRSCFRNHVEAITKMGYGFSWVLGSVLQDEWRVIANVFIHEALHQFGELRRACTTANRVTNFRHGNCSRESPDPRGS